MHRPTHNKKSFLLPDSPRSMACYHAKVMEDGIMKLTIHDCRGAIQLHNNLNNPEEIQEAFDKLEALMTGIAELQDFIYQNYFNQHALRSEQSASSRIFQNQV